MKWYDVITETYVKNAVIGYMQAAPLEAFRVFPTVNVTKMAGLFPKYAKDDWFKIGSVDEYKRSGATESAGDTFASDSVSYDIEQVSFHKDVTKADRDQMESPYDAVNDGARFVVNRIKRVVLKMLLSEYVAASIWNNEESSPTKWNATTDGVSDADPVDQVLGWQQAVEKTTGFKPNKMIVTPDCYKALRTNTKIRGLLGQNQTKIVTPQLLASLFDLDDFIILNAVNEDADGYMASGKALLVYTPDQANASKYEPSAGYITLYRNNGLDVSPRRIAMPERNDALRIEGDMYIDPVVTAPDCGYYISSLV
jgi:hypothetical protein